MIKNKKVLSLIGVNFSLSLILFAISYHLNLAYKDFTSLPSNELAYMDDLDIRWFLKPYSQALVIIGIILIIFAILNFIDNRKKAL